ncbi:MAG: hypothetical protein AAFY42_12670 [Pseudomonadota bacterium]
MSKFSVAGIALGVAIMLYGGYALAVEGNNSAFIFITGGIVIAALAAGVFAKRQSGGGAEE